MVVDLEDCVVTCFSVPGVGHGGGSGGLYCDWCSPVSVPQVLAMMVDLEDCIVTGVHLFQCPRCWR